MAEPTGTGAQRPPAPPPAAADMRFPIRYAAWVFVGTIAVYFLAFRWIESTRHREGPWELAFVGNTNSAPSVIIQQSKLGIQKMEIRFDGATWNAPGGSNSILVRLEKPNQPLPFGNRISEDLTFLPGVLTFVAFNHEIEIAPRVLVLDRVEYPWTTSSPIVLSPRSAPPPSLDRRANRLSKPPGN